MLYVIKCSLSPNKCITLSGKNIVLNDTRFTINQMFKIEDNIIHFTEGNNLEIMPTPFDEYTRIKIKDGKVLKAASNTELVISNKQMVMNEIWEIVPAEKEYANNLFIRKALKPYIPLIYLYYNSIKSDEEEFCIPNDIAYKLQKDIDTSFINEDHQFISNHMQLLKTKAGEYIEKYKYSFNPSHEYNIKVLRVFIKLFDEDPNDHIVYTNDTTDFPIHIANGYVKFALYRCLANNQIYQRSACNTQKGIKEILENTRTYKLYLHFI